VPVASANGIQLHYESFGSDADPTVVLIMGLSNQMLGWEADFCRLVASRGFRVVRFDNRDVGESTKLDQFGVPAMAPLFARAAVGLRGKGPYTLADMAADTVGLLDHLGLERAHLVGASMGGMIAQLCAIDFAERVASLTSVISSPGIQGMPWPRPRALRVLARRGPRERGPRIEHRLSLFRTIHGTGGLPFDEARVRAREERSFDRDPDPDGAVRQLAAVLSSPGRRQSLSRVRAPAAVIHGDSDPLVPLGHGEATAAALPGAELTVVPGMGHGLAEAAWPQLADAIARTAARA
jgi:pimeloyl-ACP methyl ester carboxylesterase